MLYVILILSLLSVANAAPVDPVEEIITETETVMAPVMEKTAVIETTVVEVIVEKPMLDDNNKIVTMPVTDAAPASSAETPSAETSSAEVARAPAAVAADLPVASSASSDVPATSSVDMSRAAEPVVETAAAAKESSESLESKEEIIKDETVKDNTKKEEVARNEGAMEDLPKTSDAIIRNDNAAESKSESKSDSSLESHEEVKSDFVETTALPMVADTTVLPVWWNLWRLNPTKNYSGDYVADMNTVGNIFMQPPPSIPEDNLIPNNKAAMVYFKLYQSCLVMKSFTNRCAEICRYHSYCEE